MCALPGFSFMPAGLALVRVSCSKRHVGRCEQLTIAAFVVLLRWSALFLPPIAGRVAVARPCPSPVLARAVISFILFFYFLVSLSLSFFPVAALACAAPQLGWLFGSALESQEAFSSGSRWVLLL